MTKQHPVSEVELAETVARMENRLASAKGPAIQLLMVHYSTLAKRFEVELAASRRDVALAKASALMLVQAVAGAKNAA